MRGRKLLMLALVVVAAVSAAMLGLCSSSPVVQVISDQDLDADRRVVLFHTTCGFIDRYQARLKGQWMEVQQCLRGQACIVPIGAEACRLFVEEHRLPPWARMYLVLDKSGLAARAPALCDWILRHVPGKESVDRHIIVEITLPRRAHNYPAGGNAGSALQFATERQRPGVPQPEC